MPLYMYEYTGISVKKTDTDISARKTDIPVNTRKRIHPYSIRLSHRLFKMLLTCNFSFILWHRTGRIGKTGKNSNYAHFSA